MNRGLHCAPPDVGTIRADTDKEQAADRRGIARRTAPVSRGMTHGQVPQREREGPRVRGARNAVGGLGRDAAASRQTAARRRS